MANDTKKREVTQSDGGSTCPSDFDEQGRVKELGWYHQNAYHRKSGPALQRMNPENSVVEYEEHRWLGRMHRSGSKPALIVRDPQTGTVLETRYFLNDTEVAPGATENLDPKP